MALSDGHALLVYSDTHADKVRAFDFNGNSITLTDRERDVLTLERSPPITIYGGWAYFANSTSNFFLNDQLVLHDLNQSTYRVENAFPSLRQKETKLTTVDDRNGRMVAAHLTETGDYSAPFDPQRRLSPLRLRGPLRIEVREYALPAEVNASGVAGRPIAHMGSGVYSLRRPRSYPRGGGVSKAAMLDDWGDIDYYETRLFLTDHFLYVWLPTGARSIGQRANGSTRWATVEQCYVVDIATQPGDVYDAGGDGGVRPQAHPIGSSTHHLKMLDDLHDPSTDRHAGKFTASSDNIFFVNSAGLFRSYGYQEFEATADSANFIINPPAEWAMFATRWHLWGHLRTHQIFRYPLNFAPPFVNANLRTIDAYPAGHKVRDIVGYRHHLFDFRDAPVGVTTPQPEPGAPPVPPLLLPKAEDRSDLYADLPLSFTWDLDRIFSQQWLRRREVTNPGEDDETLGAWQHWTGSEWGAFEGPLGGVRVGGDEDTRVLATTTFEGGEFGERGKTYEFGWRFTERDTLKTSAWSTETVRIEFNDRVSLPAPTWTIGTELNGREPVDVTVTLPAGYWATEIWIERYTTSAQVRHDARWWSGTTESWLSTETQPARTVSLLQEVTVSLPAGWQDDNTTTYWRVQWRNTVASPEQWSLRSDARAVATRPYELAEEATLTAPIDGSLVSTLEPLEFRGAFPVGERGDVLWLRRRAVGGTSWQWFTGRVWVDGLPQLPRGQNDSSFDRPSFGLWSGRRHRTVFDFELPAGWAAQGQRWAYSVAYRGQNYWGSEWSNETVVRANAYQSPLARETTVILRSTNAGVVSYEARNLDGDVIDLPATHIAAFAAYGHHTPDFVVGDEGWWATLNGISARNLVTGATRAVLSNTGIYALAADIDRGHFYYWRVVSSGWRLFRRNLDGTGSFTLLAQSTTAQVNAAEGAYDLKWSVDNNEHAPWLTIGNDYAYLGPFAVALDGSNDHLLANRIVETLPVGTDTRTRLRAWNRTTGNGRNFDAEGDFLFYKGTEDFDAWFLVTGGEVGGVAVDDEFYFKRARSILSSGTQFLLYTYPDYNFTASLVSMRVYNRRVYAYAWQWAGTEFVGDLAIGAIDPIFTDAFGVTGSRYNNPQDTDTFFPPQTFEGNYNDLEVYHAINYDADLSGASVDYLQPRPWGPLVDLHSNPNEPLAVRWQNGLIAYTHIAISVRERGEDEWLYFDENGRRLVTQQALAKQPAGSVAGAVERANGYLLPAGWGVNGRHYEVRLRYKAAGGGWSPWSEIDDLRARVRFTAPIPPPTLIQPAPGTNIDGSLPFEFIIEIPDGFDANDVLMRRQPEAGGTIEYWQEEVPHRQFIGSVAEGWRTDSGVAWSRSGRHPTQQIAIPLPAGFQPLDTTYLYSFLMVTSRATDGRASPWSADVLVGSLAGATQRAVAFVTERPEPPTWITKSGGFDSRVTKTLDWRFHPRLAGQQQRQFRLLRRNADDLDVIEWWGGDDPDPNRFGPAKTATTSSVTQFALPGNSQADGTTYHYAVQTRADGEEWSAISSDLVLVAGNIDLVLVAPVDGQQVGQMPRLDWRHDTDQVAYQIRLRDTATSQIIYDSGWVLGDALHADGQLPHTINSGTIDAILRVRDTSARISNAVVANDLVVSYTPAVVPTIAVTAADGDDHVNIEVGNLGEAVVWTLERWQHITAPASSVALLDAAAISQAERRLVYRIIDAQVPTGSTVTVSDYAVRAGVPYAYRATAIHLNERSSQTNWSTLRRPS